MIIKAVFKLSWFWIYVMLTIFILSQCKNDGNVESAKTFNQTLLNQLLEMKKLDHTAAWIPEGKFKQLSKEEWNAYKDSVFTVNKIKLKKIFKLHGYPSYDMVGKEGEHSFWNMVQHCDDDPAFQRTVLTAMKPLLEKDQASKSSYAYLTDRVMKNTGRKIIYGTQVKYDMATGQAQPQPMEDSLNVNERRTAMGLEPIEIYLNGMTRSHFQMNKEVLNNRGITEPKLYPIEGNKIE